MNKNQNGQPWRVKKNPSIETGTQNTTIGRPNKDERKQTYKKLLQKSINNTTI